MIVLIWVAFGIIVGLVAAKLFHHTAGALALDLSLGIAGAIAGGLAMDSIRFPPTAIVVAGLLGAAAGSVAILGGYRVIFRAV